MIVQSFEKHKCNTGDILFGQVEKAISITKNSSIKKDYPVTIGEAGLHFRILKSGSIKKYRS